MAEIERELLKGNTPTLILAVLEAGPLHGYAIAREIERRSGSELQFKEGTLYPALHGLEREEFITATWQEPAGGPARKVYSLTPAGRKALAQRIKAFHRFTAAVTTVLGGTEHDATPEPTA